MYVRTVDCQGRRCRQFLVALRTLKMPCPLVQYQRGLIDEATITIVADDM
jgi:hypothetical protein